MLPSISREESPELKFCEGQGTTHDGPLMDHEDSIYAPAKQFCDVCNAPCLIMNGRRRKLQVRYEGYVLVKRVSTCVSFIQASHHYEGNILQNAPQELITDDCKITLDPNSS